MAYVLCCLTTISMYFIILFVDNISANNEYYLHSEKMIFKGFPNIHYKLHNKSSMFKDIGFQIHVHGKTLKSAYILQHGLVYMADEYKNGSSIRSFEIVDAKLSKNHDFDSVTEGDTFIIIWHHLVICKFLPYTYVSIYMHIRKNGNVEFYLYYVYNKNNNCNITIEISSGICQVNADKSVTMMGKRVIKSVDYPGSSIVDGKVFGFTPILANVTM
uniref:Uncharacterized protein n=1 Tax=Schistosoma japonicum TaxID=6182 RepID=C1LIW4_SCHJA|nr:hypothetical protein [Schistosoma japonicum]